MRIHCRCSGSESHLPVETLVPVAAVLSRHVRTLPQRDCFAAIRPSSALPRAAPLARDPTQPPLLALSFACVRDILSFLYLFMRIFQRVSVFLHACRIQQHQPHRAGHPHATCLVDSPARCRSVAAPPCHDRGSGSSHVAFLVLQKNLLQYIPSAHVLPGQEVMSVGDVGAQYHHALFAALSHAGLPRAWMHPPSSDVWIHSAEETLEYDGALISSVLVNLFELFRPTLFPVLDVCMLRRQILPSPTRMSLLGCGCPTLFRTMRSWSLPH
jgi:hypothetical protein